MLKIPKGSKYKKAFKGKLKNTVSKNETQNLMYKSGAVILKTLEFGRLTPNQINTCRQLLNKNLKKISQIRFCIFPHIPVSKKPLEVRMGKGKGPVDKHVCNVFSGTTLIEIEGNKLPLILKGLEMIRYKLPVKTRIFYEN
jgi:large subunit ribosomal protein L16